MSRPTVNGMLIDTALDTTSKPMDIARGFLSGFASATILRNEDAVFPFSANDAGRTRERTEGFGAEGSVGNGGGVSGLFDGVSDCDEDEHGLLGAERELFVAAGGGWGACVARSLCANTTRHGGRSGALAIVWRNAHTTDRVLNGAQMPSITKEMRWTRSAWSVCREVGRGQECAGAPIRRRRPARTALPTFPDDIPDSFSCLFR